MHNYREEFHFPLIQETKKQHIPHVVRSTMIFF